MSKPGGKGEKPTQADVCIIVFYTIAPRGRFSNFTGAWASGFRLFRLAGDELLS